MTYTVAGMISGTSHDAVDVAVAEFSVHDAVVHLHPRGLHSQALDSGLRARIAELLPPNPITIDQVCRLDTDLGHIFGQVATEAIVAYGPVDLVSSHGQTVFHWVDGPTARGTLQLGAAAWIAEATRAPVVSDLRTRDIARGGQGAPLASILDAMLILDESGKRGALNLGGIANITVRNDRQEPISYDIGPASALIDAAVTQATGGIQRMDTDGLRAARGRVDTDLLERLLADPFYRLPAPKSTGKERFHAGYLAAMADMSRTGLDDLVATLTELTARLVAAECRHHGIDELVVSGGGVANPSLMDRIGVRIDPGVVRPVDDFGLPAQAKEGYLMALLGFLSAHGLAGTIASATGAETLLGSFTPGSGPLQLPRPADAAPHRMVVDP